MSDDKPKDDKPLDNSANTQAKNEGTNAVDGAERSSPETPENLQTTSAHRNADANATTIGQVKADHDVAIGELRDQIAAIQKAMDQGFRELHGRVSDLGDAVPAAKADDDAPAMSLDLVSRMTALERANGIRTPDPEQHPVEPVVQSQTVIDANNKGLV